MIRATCIVGVVTSAWSNGKPYCYSACNRGVLPRCPRDDSRGACPSKTSCLVGLSQSALNPVSRQSVPLGRWVSSGSWGHRWLGQVLVPNCSEGARSPALTPRDHSPQGLAARSRWRKRLSLFTLLRRSLWSWAPLSIGLVENVSQFR